MAVSPPFELPVRKLGPHFFPFQPFLFLTALQTPLAKSPHLARGCSNHVKGVSSLSWRFFSRWSFFRIAGASDPPLERLPDRRLTRLAVVASRRFFLCTARSRGLLVWSPFNFNASAGVKYLSRYEEDLLVSRGPLPVFLFRRGSWNAFFSRLFSSYFYRSAVFSIKGTELPHAFL